MGVFIVILVVAVFLFIGFKANQIKQRQLKAAPKGSRRIETVKANGLNRIVKTYGACGWTVDQQSSSKSLGTKARVTITFIKQSDPVLPAPKAPKVVGS